MHIRWCVDTANWEPSSGDWQRLLSLVQPEEQARIKRFVFPKDAKLALCGRLLIRTLITRVWREVRWSDIVLKRTDKNKPIWIAPYDVGAFNFNVSHHGTMVLLVADTLYPIGCDVMTLELPGRSVQTEFFRNMQAQLTPEEWRVVHSADQPQQQLFHFMTFWALKESYIKAIGVGLYMDLQELSFVYNNSSNKNSHHQRHNDDDEVVLKVKNRVQYDWQFDRGRVDDKHIYAVARNTQKPYTQDIGLSDQQDWGCFSVPAASMHGGEKPCLITIHANTLLNEVFTINNNHNNANM